MNAREAIVSDPRVVRAEASVREAAELLTHPNVKSVLVVDGDRLVGCVTPEAIVAALAQGNDLGSASAAAVADPDVTTIPGDTPVDEALRLMSERDVERVAVVDGDRFLGVLPRSPLVRRLAEDDADRAAAPADVDEGTGVGGV